MQHKTIAFITSSHSPLDERIYYQMARSLCYLYRVVIIASTGNVKHEDKDITIVSSQVSDPPKKLQFFFDQLCTLQPDIVVSSEPLPVIAAWRYKNKQKRTTILYDITEWFPSKKHLENRSIPFKILIFFKLLSLNILSSVLATGFIFGEYYKSLPYRIIFPFKKYVFISYYPDLNHIDYKPTKSPSASICLGYTGKISKEKGIESFVNAAIALHDKRPDIKVRCKIIGKFGNETEKHFFYKLKEKAHDIDFELQDWQPYQNFSKALQDVHVLVDLRKIDFENHYCLPIKLFYYAACGKPVIYSDLKAISKELDITTFGYLVNPKNSGFISDIMINYLNNPSLFNAHCSQARKLAETSYNWDNLKPIFLEFIQTFGK